MKENIISSEITKKQTISKLLPSTSTKNNLIRIQLPLNEEFHYQTPWIQWKKCSCRVDAFATIAYFILYNDFQDSIIPTIVGPKSPNELHPFGMLLKGIHNASTTIS